MTSISGALFPLVPGQASAVLSQSVTQYGITWTFDKPYPVGRFVTGDWWVIGPVTVVGVLPQSGPAPANEPTTNAQSRYGAVSLVEDKRCRNGSMIILGAEKNGLFTHQGYDSRATNYDPALTVVFPYRLPANQSLVSTVSSEAYENGVLATPYLPVMLFPEQLGGFNTARAPIALDTAAVLTCLDKEPPPDAFRPAYAGTDKTIYETKDIRWNLLPGLKPAGPVPSWEKMARLYQRPWLDHVDDWTVQYSAPAQNQPSYGGVVAYLNSFASLMLLLDVPRVQKEPLMVGFIQYGIDLHGVAGMGRQWFSDGGHWMGRKWPLLFASLLLDKPALRAVQLSNPKYPLLYHRDILVRGPGEIVPTTVFSEDVDTYYGRGADGQDALWQVGFHTHARRPFLEKPYREWDDDDKFSNTYLWTGGNWPGFALAALYLKARPAWNHDAFFDFCDWWMRSGSKKYDSKTGQPHPTRNNTDAFVQAMWDAHRANAPQQAHGTENLKWIWVDGKTSDNGGRFSATKGRFVPNPKGP